MWTRQQREKCLCHCRESNVGHTARGLVRILVQLPCHFTPGERASDNDWIGGSVDPRIGLDEVANRKITARVPQTPAVQPVVLSPQWAIPAPPVLPVLKAIFLVADAHKERANKQEDRQTVQATLYRPCGSMYSSGDRMKLSLCWARKQHNFAGLPLHVKETEQLTVT
jgi:hypothetical protein